jgi:hypothetical protein
MKNPDPERFIEKSEYTERLGLYAKAIDLWGLPAQTIMLAEEASELAIASLKVANRGAAPHLNFAEEIADVKIMIEQLIFAFGISEEVHMFMNQKIERLKYRLENDHE